jgi:general secretion pathway protein D
MRHLILRLVAVALIATTMLYGQAAPARIFPPPDVQPDKPAPQQQQPQQQVVQQAPPAPGQPAAQPRLTTSQGFLLGGVSLTEMLDIIAKMLKINYILDPRVKGQVTIYTYGEVKPVDLMPLLETILRVNNATIVKIGDLYHVIPITTISNLPVEPVMNADPKTLPDDERMILNMVFLKFATAAEIDKLLTPFYGEGASHSTYEPANLLIIQDNSRSMKRTMELINMFDSDTFAGQRVRLYDVTNSRPSDLVKDLDTVFKAYALSEKSSGVKFIPVDRINTLIAVAPNPGIFADVEKWINKLDIPVKITAGAINNYVYRLKYGRAETVAMAIMALYTGNTMALAMMAGMMNGAMGMGGGMGYAGMGAMGGGMGAMGYGNAGYGGMGYGNTGYGNTGYGNTGYGNMGYTPQTFNSTAQAPVSVPAGTSATPQPLAGQDLTGSYLGMGAAAGQASPGVRMPHVIPNPFDNTLLVQGTPQEWEQISNLLRQLDVAPRQVLIDAKIYELDLTGAFSAGVTAFLQQRTTGTERVLNATSSAAGATLSAGALVLRSHELLAALSLAESNNHSRVISAPSIIATDSIPAVMNVGQDVPVLTSSGVAVTGSSFNSVSNRSTGVTLSIMARVNSSGIVTMDIAQDVSAPQSNTTSDISSPSFSRRSFTTQVTVQDGDTVAIGGFIGETKTDGSSGVPLLNRIPILGAAFGQKSSSRVRTELIIFFTPRVIYDVTQIQDATEEIRGNLKRIQRIMKNQ